MAEINPFREYYLPNRKSISIEQIRLRYEALKGLYSHDPLSTEGFRANHEFTTLANGVLSLKRSARTKVAIQADAELVTLRYFINTHLSAAVLSSVFIMNDGTVHIRPTSDEIQHARLMNARRDAATIVLNLLDVSAFCGATIQEMTEQGLLVPRPASIEDDYGAFDFTVLEAPDIAFDPGVRYPNPEPEELVAVTLFTRLINA